MSFGIGTSLASLSMEMLDPKMPKTQGRCPMSDEEIAELQKQQQLARVNAGKKKQLTETDDFFLKFTKHRGTRLAANTVKMAKATENQADENILDTKADPARDEIKRLQRRFDAGEMETVTALELLSGDDALSDPQLQKLEDKSEAETPQAQPGTSPQEGETAPAPAQTTPAQAIWAAATAARIIHLGEIVT